MTLYYTTKEIRNTVAEVYKELNKDYDNLVESGQYNTIAYDVGYINSLCNILGKRELGQKIYNKFMKGI